MTNEAGPLQIDVCADWQGLDSPHRMGRLTASVVRGREVFAFEYDPAWLGGPHAQKLDPRLQLGGGPQFPARSRETFGLFLDSSPDRWGRVLLQRREAARARVQGRRPRPLRESDYLLGVFDGHRIGGLRFRLDPSGPFLDDDAAFASPPWASLSELEAVARRLEEEGVEDDPQYDRWLMMLLAPGRSLGGARPKASIHDPDGNLWIAKFPSRDDDENIGAWEMVAHLLAQHAGIDTAPSQCQRFGSPHHTFLTKRFDRTADGTRLHVASAMTHLERSDTETEGASYLELAEVLIQHGSRPQRDLEQLWRRVVFFVCISNVDDHLRNHGFMLDPPGWRLAPAYDMNPVPHGNGLSLDISDADNAQDLDLVREVAPFFRISTRRASTIIDEVTTAVRRWRDLAADLGLDRAARERMAPAFRVADDRP